MGCLPARARALLAGPRRRPQRYVSGVPAFLVLPELSRGRGLLRAIFPRPQAGVFLHYRAVDIQDPRHWFRATDYDFVGVVNRPEWAIPAVPLRASTPQAPSPPAYGE